MDEFEVRLHWNDEKASEPHEAHYDVHVAEIELWSHGNLRRYFSLDPANKIADDLADTGCLVGNRIIEQTPIITSSFFQGFL